VGGHKVTVKKALFVSHAGARPCRDYPPAGITRRALPGTDCRDYRPRVGPARGPPTRTAIARGILSYRCVGIALEVRVTGVAVEGTWA
jgi:hypothetical protein